MKKILIFIYFSLIISLLFLTWTALPIISGYRAKVMCSDVFISHRDPIDIEKFDLGFFPFNIGNYFINTKDSSVTCTVLGFAKKKAIYRSGFGATLLNGNIEENFRKHIPAISVSAERNLSSISWPNGDALNIQMPGEINFDKLDKAMDYCFSKIISNHSTTRALIVVYKGNIIRERYANGFSSQSVLAGWSMAKSITNAILGILVKNGRLSLHSFPVFKEWESDSRSKITVADLMHMSSGLKWWEFYAIPSDITQMLFNENDMAKFAMKKPAIAMPGEDFNYSSGSANLLSLKIRRIVGDSKYYKFPAQYLFKKIGMNHTILETDASGTFVGSSYCYATARDWARFGLLYYNDGIWNGERILPEGWVKFSTTPTTTSSHYLWGKYGALWWVNAKDKNDQGRKRYPDVPEDCFSAMGYEGQSLWIIPSKKLIVVRLSCEHFNLLDGNKFLSKLIKAINYD